MAIGPGTRVGPYEVSALIGEGGMGKVWRAHHLELKRDDALKVLPDAFANDPERLARFRREAQVLASLNHRNIAHVYGLEAADGVQALVMELVEGPTLAHRIAIGPIPAAEALRIAKQLAEALEAAHEQDIVHRDLKPANIKVRLDGTVKVLDFGLAKSLAPVVAGATAATQSTTSCGQPMTRAGIFLGTAAYMSPEQARGEAVDKRADIWAFGCVLYEMLTGRPAFPGATFSDIIAAVLRGEPEWLALPKDTPPRILELLNRCLRQDVAQRLHSIADARLEIEEALSPTHERSRWTATLVTAVVVVGILSSALVTLLILRRERSLSTAPLETTPFTTYIGTESAPAFSPDGARVAFMWDQGFGPNLYIKLVGGEDPLPVTTTPGAFSPSWSPDGRRLAFLRHASSTGDWDVCVIPALGGNERHIATTSSSGAGIAWAADGHHVIVVDQRSPGAPDTLFLLSTETGDKRQLTDVGSASNDGMWSRAAYGDMNPVLSADGRSIAFIRRSANAMVRDIYVTGVDGGGTKPLTQKGWMITGLDWTADSKAIIFAASVEGRYRLWRISASGGEPSALAGAEGAQDVSIAHAGGHLAYTQVSSDLNIWRTEGPAADHRSPPVRLIASTRDDRFPAYSPDGRRLLFQSDRSGRYALWICDADGAHCSELTKIGARTTGPAQWSPDSKWIAFTHASEPPGDPGIDLVQADSGLVRTLIDGKRLRSSNPSWSPDCRWVYFNAISADAPAQLPIWRVSASGGTPMPVGSLKGRRPRFGVDGRFLHYMKGASNGRIWRVDLVTGHESLVPDVAPAGGWTLWRQMLVYAAVDSGKRSYIAQRDLETGKASELTSLGDIRFDGENLTVSPDGRWILYGCAETTADIVLVENLR
jgi:eukaryotic-like serine/threonine-protein kinase